MKEKKVKEKKLYFEESELADLELSKRLKAEGFSLPTYYYWQDRDLAYSQRGLKRVRITQTRMNHNRFDDFIYSAPEKRVAIEWLIGKNMYYESSFTMKFGRPEKDNNAQ